MQNPLNDVMSPKHGSGSPTNSLFATNRPVKIEARKKSNPNPMSYKNSLMYNEAHNGLRMLNVSTSLVDIISCLNYLKIKDYKLMDNSRYLKLTSTTGTTRFLKALLSKMSLQMCHNIKRNSTLT
jgi:hypothetical protein